MFYRGLHPPNDTMREISINGRGVIVRIPITLQLFEDFLKQDVQLVDKVELLKYLESQGGYQELIDYLKTGAVDYIV